MLLFLLSAFFGLRSDNYFSLLNREVFGIEGFSFSISNLFSWIGFIFLLRLDLKFIYRAYTY